MTSDAPAESYRWMTTIKLTLIWAVAIAICLVPLTMVASPVLSQPLPAAKR